MTHKEACEMLSPADLDPDGEWADLGAGNGRFTKALAEILGKGGKIHAIDKDQSVLNIDNHQHWARIESSVKDFSSSLDLVYLDGILMANSLHYIKNQKLFLERIRECLKPGGMFILIEYNRTLPNPWVPYPISYNKFKKLAQASGYSEPEWISQRPSRYGNGKIYLAKCIKY